MEQLLDLLVNEEMEKAHELFHEIVVEKSRDIYENLIAEEAKEEDEEDEEQDESMEDESDDQVDEETTFEIGGDPADDLVGAVSADDEEGDDEFGGDGDMDFDDNGEIDDHEAEHGSEEERIEDLEDALEELKAEFEKLMAGEDHEEEKFPGIHGDEEGEEDDEEGEEDDEEDEGMMGMENSQVREYVERVGNDWEKGSSMKTPGPVGGGKGDLAGQATETNHQSIVSSGKGKPSTGATAHNILQAGKGVGEMSGTSPNADKGSRGLVGSTKGEYTKGVTKNKTSSSKTAMPDGAALSKVSGGHGAEKKGASGEGHGWGSGKGDKAGQTGGVNTTSPLSGAPNRNA
jgi:hypothetical protein